MQLREPIEFDYFNQLIFTVCGVDGGYTLAHIKLKLLTTVLDKKFPLPLSKVLLSIHALQLPRPTEVLAATQME